MKLLKEILQKVPTKTKEVEPYNPEATSNASKNFLKKHTVQKTDDANKNEDDVFNASHVNTYDRNMSNHGYDCDQSKAVYEAKSHKPSLSEKQKKEIAEKGKKINPKNNPNEIDAEDFEVLRAERKMKKESVDLKSMLIDISNKTKELANIVSEEEAEAWNEIENYVSSLYEELMQETQKEKQETKKNIMEKAPPGAKAESFIKKNKSKFQKRYGDRWEKVLYATAHKIFG